MNNTRTFRSVLLTAILFAFVAALACIFTSHAQAQASDTASLAAATSDAPPAIVTTAENFATPFIVAFAKSHAWLATVIMLIGTLRLLAKPIVTAVEIYVKNSPSKTDDEFVEKVEHSIGWKVFFWLLDYGASIKSGSQFTVAPKVDPAPAPQPVAENATPNA